MQTAAKINLDLTGVSSFKRFADLQRVSYSGFYQSLASELIKGARIKQDLGDLGERLVGLAEQAHAFRQMDALEQVSQFLMTWPLSRQCEAVGKYYQALCVQRFGRGDVERAVSLLEGVANGVPPRYKARVLISLAANLRHQSDNQGALSLYSEAGEFASQDALYDPFATIHTQKMFAVIASEDGDHRGAVALLENLFPLAYAMRSPQPHVFYDFMNSLAVELCEVDRLEEAKNVSQIVLASPFAHAYPEWRETLEDIELKGYRAPHATIAVGHRTSEAGNLVCLPAPEREDSATRQERIPGHTNQQARVFDLLEWKRKMGKEPNGGSGVTHYPHDTPQNNTSYKEMDGRQMLLKIMELTGSSDRTDDELERILEAIERILSEPKETGRQ